MTTPIQKLRLCDAKEGKRLNGKLMFAATVTHDEAQLLSNQGHAAWFRLVDATLHPNTSERPLIPAHPIAAKPEPVAANVDNFTKRDARPKHGKVELDTTEPKEAKEGE